MTTDDDTLRRVAREAHSSMADRRCSCERLRALDELATLVGVWRSAMCSTPTIAKLTEHVATAGFGWPGGDQLCDGDNHVSDCPVQRALDDIIAAHDKLGAPGMT